MKTASFAFATLVILIAALFGGAQEAEVSPNPAEVEQPKETTKIDEFGRLGECDLSARIQNLYIELANNPDSKGYIVTYHAADELPSLYDRSPMRDYITRTITFLRLDESRVTFIEGGYRKILTTELYLVPPGFSAPEPAETVEKPTMPKDKTFLWHSSAIWDEDEDDPTAAFVLQSVKDKLEIEAKLAEQEDAAAAAQNADDSRSTIDGEITSEASPSEDAPDVETPPTAEEIKEMRFSWADPRFGEELARRDKAKGVLIFYADDKYYDIQKVKDFVNDGRDVIANKSGIDLKRIRVIFGGYRSSIEAEFWIVPPKGKPPKASPSERDERDSSSTDQ